MKFYRLGMESEARKAYGAIVLRRIQAVAGHGVIKEFHMHANLVRPAGFRLYLQISKLGRRSLNEFFHRVSPAWYSRKGKAWKNLLRRSHFVDRSFCFKSFQNFVFCNFFSHRSARAPSGEPATKVRGASAYRLVYYSVVIFYKARNNRVINFFYSPVFEDRKRT